jgi:hypothetical protein
MIKILGQEEIQPAATGHNAPAKTGHQRTDEREGYKDKAESSSVSGKPLVDWVSGQIVVLASAGIRQEIPATMPTEVGTTNETNRTVS